MEYRGVLLIGAAIGAIPVGATTACSGPDPGAITFAERPSTGESSGNAGSGSTGGGTTSGGSNGAMDGGGLPEGSVADSVFGATTFAYVSPAVAANSASVAHAGSVEGKDCLVEGCHLGGAKNWTFGGTVYSSAQGGATVPMAEIKVVGPDGVEVGTTYTDANGNFWLDKAGAAIPAGSRVGVRSATKTKQMGSPLQPSHGGCSQGGTCHGGGAKVYVD